jgi:agmatinase
MAGILDMRSIQNRIPYQGLVTFWRADYTQDLTDVDLVTYGVAFDVDSFVRPGARYGPRSIREQSCYFGMPGIHWPFQYDFRDRRRLIDYGDIYFYSGQQEQMLTNVEKHLDLMAEHGAGTLGLGGDHLVAYPAIKAHAKHHGKLSLIHFDAHTDTHGGQYLNHGNMFSYAADEGLGKFVRSLATAVATFPWTSMALIRLTRRARARRFPAASRPQCRESYFGAFVE